MNDLETTSASVKPNTYTVNQSLQEKALIGGNLADLSPSERLNYYGAICESLGLNPLTRPFEYIVLNGKLQLYARKDCTEQLRNLRDISIKIVSRELIDGVFMVTAQATNTKGRFDESIGAVPLGNLQGEQKANAIMKAETKSKRRVTLSFCGLGMLDESEIESIPGARVASLPAQKLDKGASVLSKMKQNGNDTPASPADTAPPDDAPPHRAAPPAAHQDGGPDSGPSGPSMTADNCCNQFVLCESRAEWSQVANAWQQEKRLHTPEENTQVEKAKNEAKKRLGIR